MAKCYSAFGSVLHRDLSTRWSKNKFDPDFFLITSVLCGSHTYVAPPLPTSVSGLYQSPDCSRLYVSLLFPIQYRDVSVSPSPIYAHIWSSLVSSVHAVISKWAYVVFSWLCLSHSDFIWAYRVFVWLYLSYCDLRRSACPPAPPSNYAILT